ncbi:isoleucine--tRNA ligase [Stackebrandtia soli]|uniref:isoleucine--tRNA ligase n=1 Tax=Stackebrandtia soli TaxID=1892856 RepID=UPI0039EAAE13
MSDPSPFAAQSPHLDLSTIDHEVLAFWRDRDVFQRSVDASSDKPLWMFYEGPPTANGRPGTHHVEARVFKDVFPRFKTMKGFHVPRKAGWDCHGLPVEIAVEKELGLSGKQDVERVGIAKFNEQCRASVQRFVGEFEAMTERVGYWVDMSEAYWTMAPQYVESVWWAIKTIYDRGLLVENHRVAPYCPRCGTGLSDHEVAQGYETVKDPSVYIRMPAKAAVAGIDGVDLLIWTTTPWTLVSNTAVAVHPDVTYAVVRAESGTFLVAEPLVASVLGDDVEVLATLPGAQLEGLAYERPLDFVEIPDAHRVILADYVTTADGTGLVHQAPAFGADDLETCRRYGLPVVNPVDNEGKFLEKVPLVGGMFFKSADAVLIDELNRRGVLFRHQEYEHPYPHCWRCHTPLMYYAQLSWYITTTAIKDALLRENENTNWYPEHIKNGRFGDWLTNNVDWALSRNRYWGTPLPIWRCGEGHTTCVESRVELGRLTGRDLSDLDPHRPFIDDVTFPCPECATEAIRVPEVIDAWFDSGSMPFAQLGYPFVEGSREKFEQTYPAQFISEAIDQTRGWFYTLMAIGTLVFDKSSYENVVCLGHILAEDGRKMSKHLGNILEPMPLMDKFGADTLRWFMLCSGSPWSPRKIGDGPLEDISRNVLLSLWNTVSFFSLYADANDWRPSDRPVELTPLDRWLRAELHHLVSVVDSSLENFDTVGAGRALTQFIDDLSNWYIRLSRSRFWSGDEAAHQTLYETIEVLTRLLAPFVPFVTEHIWKVAVRPGDAAQPESVHLTSWPVVDETALDEGLRTSMTTIRSIVEAGRAARKASKIRVRQPLSRVLYAAPGGAGLGDDLLAYVADELNVREVTSLTGAGEVLDVSVKPNFREIGKRFGSSTQQVAAAIMALDPADVAAGVDGEKEFTLTVDGAHVTISAADVLVKQTPREGWAVADQRGVVTAIDTTITPQLRRAGLAREAIRLIQEARKKSGLEITDRIRLTWAAEGETATALREHESEVAQAVLATVVTEAMVDDAAVFADEDLELRFTIEAQR